MSIDNSQLTFQMLHRHSLIIVVKATSGEHAVKSRVIFQQDHSQRLTLQ
jgi:hypothetical protein